MDSMRGVREVPSDALLALRREYFDLLKDFDRIVTNAHRFFLIAGVITLGLGLFGTFANRDMTYWLAFAGATFLISFFANRAERVAPAELRRRIVERYGAPNGEDDETT